MGNDQPKPPPAKPNGAETFVIRLCVIAWVGAMFGEVLPRGYMKSGCLLFGSHAAALGLVAAVVLWLVRRRATLFLLALVTTPPAIYFAIVIGNIAKARHWIP